MASESIRVRFAPSPTGLLHVGNARTALFNWLFARHSGGKLILRIEDTDSERTKASYEKQLLQDLSWLGINWDEGPNEADLGETGEFGPYRQSKRLDLYATHTAQLLADGKAYRCFCTPEELEEERQQAIADHRPQVYSGKCRVMSKFDIRENLLRGKTYSVRLRIPDRPIRFHDIIRGDMEFGPETVSDPILVRSAQGGTAGATPGVPVYNYVVTIDDALMGITHVIRGDDHIANTPKQVAIYEAFGWQVPQFAHLSAILGPDHERLSKRHGATSMSSFREMGYLPETLINHLVLLGWSPEEGKPETLTPDQLVSAFSLERITSNPTIFDFEKLNGLNRHYLKLSPPARLAALCWDYFGGLLPEKEVASDAVLVWFFHMIAMFVPLVNRLGEIPAKAAFIFHMDPNLVRADKDNEAVLAAESARLVLTEIANRVREHVGAIAASDFSTWMNEVKAATGVNSKELFQPVRIALTGTPSGPEFDKLIPIIEQGAALNVGPRRAGQRLAAFLGVCPAVNDIFWIADTGLAIVLRPRGDDWLENDLQRIQMAGIQIIVSTVENWEARSLGLAKEADIAQHLGMHFISYPIQDRSVPADREDFTHFVSMLVRRLHAGEKIGVHCRGCVGRSTVVAASTLIKFGWSAERALDEIEVARGCSVPDTEEQRDWILAFGDPR